MPTCNVLRAVGTLCRTLWEPGGAGKGVGRKRGPTPAGRRASLGVGPPRLSSSLSEKEGPGRGQGVEQRAQERGDGERLMGVMWRSLSSIRQ